MLTLSPPKLPELDLQLGNQLQCSSCTRRLFIPIERDLHAALASANWRQALTADEHLPCVCPACAAELEQNEQEQNPQAQPEADHGL